MQTFPHHYAVTALASPDGDLDLQSAGLPVLHTALPAEFGGPGDRWSPETLLVAAVADCFLLTFRGVARAQELSWTSLQCEVTGILDRVERGSQFTEFHIKATLGLAPGMTQEAARRVLERAERGCLITNSMKASRRLEAVIEIAPALQTV